MLRFYNTQLDIDQRIIYSALPINTIQIQDGEQPQHAAEEFVEKLLLCIESLSAKLHFNRIQGKSMLENKGPQIARECMRGDQDISLST